MPANIVVTNTSDSGFGSLRAALVACVDATNTITFDLVPSNPGWIDLQSGLIVSKSVSINGLRVDGGGGSVAVRRAASVDDTTLFSLIDVQGQAGSIPIVTLSNFGVYGGHARDIGGGILNEGGDLTVQNCIISGNRADINGGGICNRDRSGATGKLVVSASIIDSNQAVEFGGGIYNFQDGPVSVQDKSFVTANTAGFGGGLYNAGNGSMRVTDSTIAYNLAKRAGGIYNWSNPASGANGLFVKNCLIDRNIASNPGVGDAQGGGVFNRGRATLESSTVSRCEAEIGSAGIQTIGAAITRYNGVTETGNILHGPGGRAPGGTFGAAGSYVEPGGVLVVANSIIAGNILTDGHGAGPSDAGGDLTSQGHNLIGAVDGSTGWVGSDLTGTAAAPLDPLLGTLGDYGGPTQSIPLLPGSPAIGQADPATATYTDQRGFLRTSTPSIGAFEYGATRSVPFRLSVLGPVTAGVPVEVTVTALDAAGNVLTGYASAPVFSSTDAGAGLPQGEAFTPGDGGTHTFVLIFSQSGQVLLTVTDPLTGLSAVLAVDVQ